MLKKNAPITLAQLNDAHKSACDLLRWINSFQLMTRDYLERLKRPPKSGVKSKVLKRVAKKPEPDRRQTAATFLARYDAKLEAAAIIPQIHQALSAEKPVKLFGQPATSFHEAVYLVALSFREAIDNALHEAACEAELFGSGVEEPPGGRLNKPSGLHAWTATSWDAMVRVLKIAPVKGISDVATRLELERIGCVEKYDLLEESPRHEIEWDPEAGSLRVGEDEAILFPPGKRRAPEQEDILDAFQNADWPGELEIENVSLHIMGHLNNRIKQTGRIQLVFHGNGRGTGYRRAKS